jgi:hypothetical protein
MSENDPTVTGSEAEVDPNAWEEDAMRTWPDDNEGNN